MSHPGYPSNEKIMADALQVVSENLKGIHASLRDLGELMRDLIEEIHRHGKVL